MTRQTSHCHGSKLRGRTEPSNSLALHALLVLSWRLKTRLALWHAVVLEVLSLYLLIRDQKISCVTTRHLLSSVVRKWSPCDSRHACGACGSWLACLHGFQVGFQLGMFINTLPR